MEKFGKINDAAAQDNLSRIWEKLQAGQVQSKFMRDPIDYYRNGIEQKYKPIFLKPGTPLSSMSLSELPSPRVFVENQKMKNARLLPNYDGPDHVRSLSNLEYKSRQASRNRQQINSESSGI